MYMMLFYLEATALDPVYHTTCCNYSIHRLWVFLSYWIFIRVNECLNALGGSNGLDAFNTEVFSVHAYRPVEPPDWWVVIHVHVVLLWQDDTHFSVSNSLSRLLLAEEQNSLERPSHVWLIQYDSWPTAVNYQYGIKRTDAVLDVSAYVLPKTHSHCVAWLSCRDVDQTSILQLSSHAYCI